MTKTDRHLVRTARRLVVKVGSSSISGENVHQIDVIVDAIAPIHLSGVQVVLVSSGAIATGLPFLNLKSRPTDLATSQAAAAVGQNILINRWQESLSRYDIVAAQVLLTAGDLSDAEGSGNAHAAIEKMLELGVLPIVNENDTVATTEIRFGDNDRLAALVARLLAPQALILLSDVDALYTAPPGSAGARKIDVINHADDVAGVDVGDNIGSGVGTGGATTKIGAGLLAAENGVGVLLTSTALVVEALAGESVGTWFTPHVN